MLNVNGNQAIEIKLSDEEGDESIYKFNIKFIIPLRKAKNVQNKTIIYTRNETVIANIDSINNMGLLKI